MIYILNNHYNDRPPSSVVNTAVIHYTDTFDVYETIYTLEMRKVSCHFLICEFGRIFSFVPIGKRAWHAGESEFLGIKNVNDFSIGIELQNPGEKFFQKYGFFRPYTSIQMDTLIVLLKDLKLAHITGHSFIAPQRKKDPGPHFNWDKIKQSNVGCVWY